LIVEGLGADCGFISGGIVRRLSAFLEASGDLA
jgi:hypothetical protein